MHGHIESLGYKIENGLYLYFDGKLTGDLTSYEIFHGYCLALTFFYTNGRASCKAVQETGVKDGLRLYIDKFDKFGVDPDDVVTLEIANRAKIDECYQRILPHMATKDFNPVRNSIEFFSLFSKEYEIRVRLLYLSICLESLFLEGNDIEGIGHKLGLRCAAFLSHFDAKIDSSLTFSEVKIGYALRSKIIHGANYQKESKEVLRKPASKATKESDHALILEKILKNVFHSLLLSEEFYTAALDRTLGNKIDQELVLDKLGV